MHFYKEASQKVITWLRISGRSNYRNNHMSGSCDVMGNDRQHIFVFHFELPRRVFFQLHSKVSPSFTTFLSFCNIFCDCYPCLHSSLLSQSFLHLLYQHSSLYPISRCAQSFISTIKMAVPSSVFTSFPLKLGIISAAQLGLCQRRGCRTFYLLSSFPYHFIFFFALASISGILIFASGLENSWTFQMKVNRYHKV